MKNFEKLAFYLLFVLMLSACGGSGSSSDNNVTETETEAETETETESNIDPDANILTAWIINEDMEMTAHIDGGLSLVHVQSVEANEDSVVVTATGLPNYSLVMTQELHGWLNNSRPGAATDFDTGETIIDVGETVEFGQDIGYAHTECGEDENDGQGYWPFAGAGCAAGDDLRSGTFPAFPEVVENPTQTTALTVGWAINGVSIFNWLDNMSYNGDGVWRHLASIAEIYDVDICGGHPAGTEYHHHHFSDCWAETVGEDFSGHSPIYGYVADGFPIYGPLEDTDVLAQSCWVERDYDVEPDEGGYGCVGFSDAVAGDRTCQLIDPYDPSLGVEAALPAAGNTSEDIIIRGAVHSGDSGFYFEDYYYDETCTANGDEYLDEHNGHTDDDRGYHYHMTVETMPTGDYAPVQATFPFLFGPAYAGDVTDSDITQGGGRP